MKITNQDCLELSITDLPIEGIEYESVKVVVNINDSIEISKTYPYPLDTDEISMEGNDVTLHNNFFYNSEVVKDLGDGIYTISLIFKEGDDYHVYKNCIYIDCRIKCLLTFVTSKSLNKDSKTSIQEKAVVINMLQYALTEGSNCGCNCEELQDIYDKLMDEISETINTDDCGC